MKRYRKINQITKNPFLNLFEIEAYTSKGNEFQYYFVSRNKMEKLKINSKKIEPEGVVIYPILKEDPGKIVLIRQYRYPLDEFIYELPAGLVDQGETVEIAAIREMKEETGLIFQPYREGAKLFRRPFFMGAGFTDETSCTVFGYASGVVSHCGQEETEAIQVVLADKKEVQRILQEERVSLRCAFLMMSFLKTQVESPFEFLNLNE